MSGPLPIRSTIRLALAGFAGLAILLASAAAPPSAAAPSPRIPSVAEPLVVAPDFESRLVVKFRDDLRARARLDGRLESRVGADLAPVEAVAAAFDARFSRLIQLPDAKLTALEERAAARSGRAQPDLAGMCVVEAGPYDPERLVALSDALRQRPEVEWTSLEAILVPPPTDLPPTTPDYSANQGYRFGNPGINSEFAAGWGVTGQGVRISDCEYGWNADHEDLNEIDLHQEPGITIHPDVEANNWDEHGTAVIGAIAAMPNAYGCTGMAPDAEIYTYPEYAAVVGSRRVTCVTNAIADSGPGDVVLLEMQAIGAGGDYGPAELNLSIWTVTRTGTDAGVLIVGAAGNGNQDLDSAPYEPYMNRGDSGAVIVGAGSATTLHVKLSFSTYGSRVNVQGWGNQVDTIGYGDIAINGTDELQFYTTTFGGTSSASPIVASACALIQSYMIQTHGTPLAPDAVRQLLIDTGWPQHNPVRPIGPAVDLEGALTTLAAAVSVAEVSPAARGSIGFHRVVPNPFSSETDVKFQLTAPGEVVLTVHDVAGRRVRTLATGRTYVAGPHSVRWDGRGDDGASLASGIYFYRLRAGDEEVSGRLTRRR